MNLSKPDTPIMIMQTDSRRAEELALQEKADLVMTLEPGPDYRSRNAVIEPAYHINYLLIAPPEHPLRRKKNVRLQDIVAYPLILWAKGSYSRHVVEHALQQQGLLSKLEVIAETDNSAFTASCVRAGIGIGIIAGHAKGPLCEGLMSRPLDALLGRPRIVFVWRKGAVISPLVLELAATIRESAF
jgi:DNA-binding transcriptional LysR family regulator